MPEGIDKGLLEEYIATANSGKYKSMAEVNAKFPELKDYSPDLLEEYVATANSGKYKTLDEVNSKFPEFSTSAKPAVPSFSTDIKNTNTNPVMKNSPLQANVDKPVKIATPTYIDPTKVIKTKDVVDINAEKAPKTMAQIDEESRITMQNRNIFTLTQRGLDESIEYQNLLVKKQAKELGYTDDKTLNGTTAVQKLANDREEGWKEDYLEPEELAQVRAFDDYQVFKEQGKEKESNEALQKYLKSRTDYRKGIDNDIVNLKGELASAEGDDAVLIKATIAELEAKKLPFYDPKKQMESFLTENETDVAAVSRPTETAQEKLKKYILAQDNLVHNLRNRLGLTDKNHSFQRFTDEWKVLSGDKRQRDDLEFLHNQELKLKNAVQILELNRTPLDKDSAWGVFAKEYVGGLIPQVKGFSGTDNTIAANIGNIVQDADITYAANEKQVQTAKFANNQYQFGSAKWIAQNLAPTLAVMTEMIPAAVLTEGIGSIGYLSRLSRPLKILAERGSLGKAGGAFFKVIQANKYGRGLLKAAASGVNYGIESQAVTTLAPQLKDEMGFSNGLFAGTVGSVAGQLAGKVMETSLKSIATLFGNKAPQAIAAIEKYGSVIAKAKEFSNTVAGETTEEYGEQLMSIYKESSNYKNFIYNLKKHYETTDALEEFATILMMSVGAPAGSTLGRSLFDASKKAYNNLNRKERETASRMAEEIHNEVNLAMDDAANQTIRDENIQVPTRSVEEQDNTILQKQKDLKLPTAPEVVLSDVSKAAMAKMEGGEALTIEELKELSNELYQRYNGISATKDQDSRQFTTEQINETLVKLENNITLLENSKNKLEESGETSIVVNPKEAVTQEAKPVTSAPNTKFYQGVDFKAQTGLPNGDYTEEQVKAARENKLKEASLTPAEIETINAEQEIIPSTETPAAPTSGVSGEVQALSSVESTAKALDGNQNATNIISGDEYYHGTSLPKSEADFTAANKDKGVGVRSNAFMGTSREQKSLFFFITSERDVANDFAQAKADYNNEKLNPKEKHNSRIIPFKFDEKNSKVLDLTKDDYEQKLSELGFNPMNDYGIGMYDESMMWEYLDNPNFYEKLKLEGYDAVKYVEPKRGVGIAVLNTDKIVNSTPKGISEAYHKAKADGSNPELVKAVEELLIKKTTKQNDKENITGVQSNQREGQEPKQTKPNENRSAEEISAGGNVQGNEEKVTKQNEKSNNKNANEANGQVVLEGVRQTGNEDEGRKDSEQLQKEIGSGAGEDNVIVYRGGENKDSGWVSNDKKHAENYGKVEQLYIPKNLNILDADLSYSTFERLVEEYDEDHADFDEYKFEPPKEFIDFLKRKGYDGLEHETSSGNNKLIFDQSKIKAVEQSLPTQEVKTKPLSEQIEDLRAAEKAEYAALKTPTEKAKKKIYDRYDKLITPLIREQKAAKKVAEITPKEGDTSTTKSARGMIQNMVFKDGEWQIKFGKDFTKVAKAAQQEAQDAFNEKNKVQTTNNLKDGKDQNQNEGRGNEPIETNTGEVRNNGRDAIGERGRTESEKNASRAEAKEKIISKINNVSLSVANQYNKIAGLAKIVAHKFKNSDKEEQSKAGKVYEKLQDATSPTYKETELERGVFEGYKAKYPELIKKYDIKNYKELVEKSYEELAKEVEAQFNLLPIRVDFHTGEKNYENSAEMLDDVHNFGHLWVFKGGDDHPITGSKTLDKNGLTINDKFRAVHDYFGHSINGYEFGKNGEENAWIEHSKMFSPLAQLALSSETRGQNSVVNYSGINDAALEKMKTAASLLKKGLAENNAQMIAESKKLLEEANNEFQFTEQKAVILPEEYTNASQYFKEQAPVTEPAPIVEEEEQYEPITVSDTSHDTFTKDNAIDYEEGEKEGDNGRSYTYLASVTVELIDDVSGETLGTISKLKDEDGEITWSAETNDGDQVADEVGSKSEAQKALVDNFNKQKAKEFNKEKAKAAKEKIKEAEKVKNKAQKIADKEQKALEKIKEKEARKKKLEDLARESGLDISEDGESPVFSVELNENLAEDQQYEVKTIVEEAISNPEFATSEVLNIQDELSERIPMQQIVVDENDTRPEAQMMSQLSIPLDFIFGKSIGIGMSDTLTTGERTVPVMDIKTGKIADKKVREEGGIGYPFKSLMDLINGTLAEGRKAMGWAGINDNTSTKMKNAAKLASKITGKELKAHYFKNLKLTAEQKQRIEDAIPDKKEYGIIVIYKMGDDGIKSNEAYAREAFRLIDVTLSAEEKQDFFKKVKERLVGNDSINWLEKSKYRSLIENANSFLELENVLHGADSKIPLLVKADILKSGLLSTRETESSESVNPVGFLLKSKGITVESVADNISEPIMNGITMGQPMLAIAVDPDAEIFNDVKRERHGNYPYSVEGLPIGIFQETAPFHNLSPELMDVFVKSTTTQVQEIKNPDGVQVSVEIVKFGTEGLLAASVTTGAGKKAETTLIEKSEGKTEEQVWDKLKKMGYTPRISIFQNSDGTYSASEGSSVKKFLLLDKKGSPITAKTIELLYDKLKKAEVKLDKEFKKTRFSIKINGSTFTTVTKKLQLSIIRIYNNPKLTPQEKLVKHLSKAFPNVTVELTASEYDKLQQGFIEKKLFTKNGKSYGFVKDGRVYLNPTYLNNNTPIHEFGHIWNAVAKNYRPELYKKGADLIKNTKYTQSIINSPSYQKIITQIFGSKAIIKNKATGKFEINTKAENFEDINDYIIDEALARAIGDKGELFATEVQKRKSFQDWMNLLFDAVKKIAGFESFSAEEFQNLTIDQFVNAALKELLGGKQISDITSDKLSDISKESAYAKFSVTDKEKEFRKNALAQGYTNKEIDTILKKSKKPSVAPEGKATENESPTTTTEQAEFTPNAKDIESFKKILGTTSGAIRNKNIAEAVKINPKVQEIMDNFDELKKQLMASVELTEDCSW